MKVYESCHLPTRSVEVLDELLDLPCRANHPGFRVTTSPICMSFVCTDLTSSLEQPGHSTYIARWRPRGQQHPVRRTCRSSDVICAPAAKQLHRQLDAYASPRHPEQPELCQQSFIIQYNMIIHNRLNQCARRSSALFLPSPVTSPCHATHEVSVAWTVSLA